MREWEQVERTFRPQLKFDVCEGRKGKEEGVDRKFRLLNRNKQVFPGYWELLNLKSPFGGVQQLLAVGLH